MDQAPASNSRARLFVALDLPDPVREGLAAWGSDQLSDPALRPVVAESLHITLAFLGNREMAEVGVIAAAMAQSALPVPSIELLGVAQRPPRGRPRLFAVAARSEGAVALQSSLAGRLVAAGLFEPEKRAFWPHVTVARVRTEGGGAKRPMLVQRHPGAFPEALSKAFRGVRMTLYRSELQPRGARYVPMAQVELSADGRQ